MSFSDAFENELLDHIFGNTAYSQEATFYVGLTTAAILDTDTGSTVTEPVGNGYARVAYTNSGNWTVASGSASNDNVITFPTATGSWGTVTHFFIADAASAGTIIGYGTLTASKTVDTDDVLSFAASALTITLD